MRITIIQGAFLPVPPISGGATEKIWFALGKEFAKRGHEVTHISRRYAKCEREELIDGVRHIRIQGFDTPRSLLRLKWNDLIYSRRALRVLPEADILVTNTFWLPLLAPEGRCGKIYVHIARYPKGQIKFYGKAARLQTVSNAVKNAIFKEAPRLGSRVKMIPNFVDCPTVNVSGRSTNILYVGRLHPEKGISLLLDGFARFLAAGCRDWRLQIVGPWEVKYGGGGERYWRQLLKKSESLRGLVEWVGPLFNADALAGHYERSALFVYPSLAERGESFGLAPLEAMAAGCPPIVSSLECFQDFITPNLNGWTFDHHGQDGPENLANVLKRVTADPEQLSRAGERARQTAQEYTLPKIATTYLDDFEKVLCHV